MENINNKFKKSLHITIPLILAVLIYMVIEHFDVVAKYIDIVNLATKPFIIGFFIAFLFCSPINFVEDKLLNKLRMSFNLKRTMSILIVYVFVILVVTLSCMLILPQIILSIKQFAHTAPNSIDKFLEFLKQQEQKYPDVYNYLESIEVDYETIMQWIKDLVINTLPHIVEFTTSITKGLYNVLMGLIASIYMLAKKEKFAEQGKKIIYAILDSKVAKKIIKTSRYSFNVFTRFLIGKLIDSIIIGILCAILMSIFKMPYVILISFIIGVTNIIPFFGPFIGAIPGIIIIFTVNPVTALWFAVLILALQQFDGNILGPKILGDSTGISAFWVFFAIIIFGNFFGFMGMLLGVPAFAVIYSLIKEYVNYRLKLKNIDASSI